ncbi:MAG: hypothetical protein ACRDRZ_07400 [Pseudonocardiaceae bacterium]
MSVLRRWWHRITGRAELPEGFTGRLDAAEHVLAVGALVREGHLVVTQLGLWVPEGSVARRIGWEWVSKAVWDRNALLLTEAVSEAAAGEAVLLADLPPRRFVLTEPGTVPDVVRARVTGSIRSSQYRELPGGGAWFVQRRLPGRDGVVLQVRADPGTDRWAVQSVAAQVADRMRQARSRPERS